MICNARASFNQAVFSAPEGYQFSELNQSFENGEHRKSDTQVNLTRTLIDQTLNHVILCF